jgi:hypothetical protein
MASHPESDQSNEPRPMTNAELTREVQNLRRQQIDVHNQMQNLIAKVANLERSMRVTRR